MAERLPRIGDVVGFQIRYAASGKDEWRGWETVEEITYYRVLHGDALAQGRLLTVLPGKVFTNDEDQIRELSP